MATTYTAEELAGGVLITEEINGETDFNFTFPDLSGNLTSGSISYFTFESLRNPLTQTFSASIAYAKGEKEVGVNSKIQIKPTGSFPPQFENNEINNIAKTDNYVWSAVLQDGGDDATNVIVWTPDIVVPVGGARLQASGDIILEVN
tara:strand:- start:271 stop:711 length:441 start_codon:yes stop_codon:yes gene_type:complete